jgi:hypothetical protein
MGIYRLGQRRGLYGPWQAGGKYGTGPVRELPDSMPGNNQVGPPQAPALSASECGAEDV